MVSEVNPTQLMLLAGLSALLLLAMRLGYVARLGRFGFYGAFALAVTASVQLVGVYLVFSSLIVPALALRFAPAEAKAVAAEERASGASPAARSPQLWVLESCLYLHSLGCLSHLR